jgi:hypothetical protein
MTRGVLAAGAALFLAVGSWVAAPFPAASAQPLASGCVAQITTYRFRPATVAAGATSTLVLKVQDCTNHAVAVSLEQFGGGSGCPVLDPVSAPATLRPGHTYVRRQTWTAPDCAGPLTLTIRVDSTGGAVLATSSASLTITP